MPALIAEPPAIRSSRSAMADNNSPALQVAAEPKSGLPKFLDEVDLTAMEFGFLAAFWVGICILVSVVDPAVITESTPFYLLMTVVEQLPLLFYISVSGGGLYAIYKFRSTLSSSLVAILSRMTRSFRR
mmetsp:Transcript_34128/g.77320  ORF Transcript_34128/g.77320 Transcript_34128/m.77320 type:complete len:129 (-) Transcript_34128:373-759(-)